MRKRDIAMTSAICGSLVLHGVLLLWLALAYIHEFNLYYTHLGAPKAHEQAANSFNFSDPDLPEPPPQKPKPPPPPIPDVEDNSGEKVGEGDSPNSTPGDMPAQPRHADLNQAAISRDPGNPGAAQRTDNEQPLYPDMPPGGKTAPTGKTAHAALPDDPSIEPNPSQPIPPVALNLNDHPSIPKPREKETRTHPDAPTNRDASHASDKSSDPNAPDLEPTREDKSQKPAVARTDEPVAPPTHVNTEGEASAPPTAIGIADASKPMVVTASSQPAAKTGQAPALPPPPLAPQVASAQPSPSTQPTAVPPPKPQAAEHSSPIAMATPAAPAMSPGSSAAPPAIPALAGHSGSDPPAHQSDEDSDAFSKTLNATIKDGKVEARTGRKIKLKRPDLNNKGLQDLWYLPNPSVTLRLSMDKTGKVIDVFVLKSSGSNEVDTPTYLAGWQSWIEPPKNAKGDPIPDTVFLQINWLQ